MLPHDYLPQDPNVDELWQRWSDSTTLAARMVSHADVEPPPPQPVPGSNNELEQRIMDTVAGAAGNDVARAIRAGPAWHVLTDTVQNLDAHGLDFSAWLHAAAREPLDSGPPGAILAGRLRRAAALPTDPSLTEQPSKGSAGQAQQTWTDDADWNPFNDPTWRGPEPGIDL
jgi:hypothetical protein